MALTLESVIVVLTVLVALGLLAYVGYSLALRKTLAVGAIVQVQFTGTPAYLMTALAGPRGELYGSLTQTDALSTMFCDVPGSGGAYSSWFRAAGAGGSASPSVCASYTTHNSSAWSCTTDQDCLVQPWQQCGAASLCWQQYSAGFGADSQTWTPDKGNTNCCNSSWTMCSATSADGSSTAFCASSLSFDPGLPTPLYTCSMPLGRCQWGSNNTCIGATPCSPSTAIVGNSTCTGLAGLASASAVCDPDLSVCTPDAAEHVMINVPWLAEGTVTAINSDGSANVEWQRLKMLYPYQGPSLSWMGKFNWQYTNCTFASDGTAPVNPANGGGSINAQARYMLFGDAANGVDVAGIPTPAYAAQSGVAGTLPWTDWDPNLGYGWTGPYTPPTANTSGVPGLPTLLQDPTGGSQTAWGLTALSISAADLVRVPAYTIVPTVASTADNVSLLASFTNIRTAAMLDRPPHLRIWNTS